MSAYIFLYMSRRETDKETDRDGEKERERENKTGRERERELKRLQVSGVRAWIWGTKVQRLRLLEFSD